MAVELVAVVPTLGRSPLLAEALAALEAETREVTLEIVLVGPEAVVGRPPGPVGRVVPTPGPLGFAAASNLGIGLGAAGAGSPFVAAVNDDAVVAAGWAATLLAALAEHPDAAAAQGVVLDRADPRLADGCGLAWGRGWQAVQLGHGRPAPPPDAPVEERFGVSATAAVYRRQALLEVSPPPGRLPPEPWAAGPFDPRLGSYYEDVDLAVRLRSKGYGALAVPAARAAHAGSATSGRRPVGRWRLVFGNRWLVVARLFGRRLPGQAPAMLARDLAEIAGAAARGDLRRALGGCLGLARAARLLPAFAHRGEPLVPLSELARFRVSS